MVYVCLWIQRQQIATLLVGTIHGAQEIAGYSSENDGGDQSG